MKKCIMLAILLYSVQMMAQPVQGSIMPNFTAVDLDGNSWTLYDILEEGKSVVIDISATWCGPCWSYHQTHILEDFYQQYGPEGTDEAMVLWIEGDGDSNIECITDSPGCNSNTYGDWTAGTTYPIIDYAEIVPLIDLLGYPTILHICPDRILNECGPASLETLAELTTACPQLIGDNNASLLPPSTDAEAVCVGATFTPEVSMQNQGEVSLTSADLELFNDGVSIEIIEWTGSLETWETEEVSFSNVTIDATASFEVLVSNVNGGMDDYMDNNSLSIEVPLAEEIGSYYLLLELSTDSYPQETSWELKNSGGTIVHSGGPYSEASTTLSIPIPVDQDDCYEFSLYDSYGDGLQAAYSITTPQGTVVDGSAGIDGLEKHHALNITGGLLLANHGGISGYSGEGGDLCTVYSYTPTIEVFNLGTSDLTTGLIEVRNNGTVIQSIDWSGSLGNLESEEVALEMITITENADLEFALVEANGTSIASNDQITAEAEFYYLVSENTDWTLALLTDEYSYETYWEIRSSGGDLLASGGNEQAGSDGSGTTSADDPNAMVSSQVHTFEFSLPPLSECIEFRLIDSYGDGIFNGELTLQDGNGNVLIDEALTGEFTVRTTSIELDVLTSVEEFNLVNAFTVYPVPVQDRLLASFELQESSTLSIEVFDMQGRRVHHVTSQHFNVGPNQIDLELNHLADGAYVLSLSSDSRVSTQPFIKSKN